ncbi:MAG: hypothetical protein K6357_06270 [Elusimicrobiota bacterium]
MNKKALFFGVLPLLIFGARVLYKIYKSNISLIDLKSKKELEFHKKDAQKKDLEINYEDNFSNNSDKSNFTDKTYSSALIISGEEDFKSKIKDSLRLLWLYDKENSFTMIRRYIFEIRQSNRTGFIFDGEKPVIEISQDKYLNSSLTFLASILAHQGWHGYYLITKKQKDKKDIPPPGKNKIDMRFANPFGKEFKKFDDLYNIEAAAFEYQLSVLKKINAPKSEIRLIEKRDLKDFTLSHDGNYLIQF